MVQQTSAELELAELLVEALNLDGVEPESIAPDALLFGEGLGLDSIDALEIALAISQKYGVQMKAEDEVTKDAFSTLRSLSAFIERSR